MTRRQFLPGTMLAVGALIGPFGEAAAQTIDARHWQGAVAATRQPEQVVAGTIAEWRSLWSRVGIAPPDVFEPGRMHAVGIFLGRRAGEGYSVNILSASRRRDRIVVVFEERMPAEIMMAQRSNPAPRPVSGAPPLGAPSLGAPSLGPPSLGPVPGPAAGFTATSPGAVASLAPPARPVGQPTSPWAIVLINRADLPVSVEQRLFR